MKQNPEPSSPEAAPAHAEPDGRRLALLSLLALGVVFGDIGTSPLYALRECFHGAYGVPPTPENLLGVLSLMFWSLLIVVTIKYITLILRADNHGEGGVLALTALARPAGLGRKGGSWALVGLGLVGASLLYGDGMITPAISVLSAIEGLKIATPVFEPYVIPVTVVVLAALFLFQPRGTTGVGILFGPVILAWFCAIGSFGLLAILREPDVLAALGPWHGLDFLLRHHVHGFLVLGAVFLVVTGAEALYADMGHFGRRPIRFAWFAAVLPALLLNYFGQGALLLRSPEQAHHPFYALVPASLLIPMVVLATSATVIASQAVISATFSLTRQAVQLGYLPRLRILHTSPEQMGQIYIPQVNWSLMLATIGLVVGFGSSSGLAAAYGVAVAADMLIATVLFYAVARKRWSWSRLGSALAVGPLLLVDLSFFGSTISKIAHGAWFPLVIAGGVFTLMMTWRKGRDLLAERLRAESMNVDEFLRLLSYDPPARIPGRAVFLTANPDGVPTALLHNLKHNKILHAEIAFLTVQGAEIPRVPRDEKVEVDDLGSGFHRIVARYGFMEGPNVPHILALAREKGLDFKLQEISFFLGRERVLPGKKPGMSAWRMRIFSFMARNSLDATAFYNIPANQVVEIGSQLRI
jgi:KUP system potassium uptake protein